MKLIKSIVTKSDCYKTNEKIKVKGLMLHSVGCNQPSAEVFVKTWNQPDKNVCCHALIDGNTGVVYQTLSWDHRGWHCGSKDKTDYYKKRSGNNTHIGVEMCEPSTIKYTGASSWADLDPAKTKAVVMRTYKTAVELFAYLCGTYNLNPLGDGVIVSHSEGYKLGIASNHGDVEHIWKKYGLTMDGFRKEVKAAMDKVVKTEETKTAEKGTIYRVQCGAFSKKENATALMEKLKKAGFEAIITKK